MNLTAEEIRLLDKLRRGELDGAVGDEREYRNYRRVLCGMKIEAGTPIAYRQWLPASSAPDRDQADDHEAREEKHYDTDEGKLEFLQRFGWLMGDEDVRAYSAKYKPQKKAPPKNEDKIEDKILELELDEAAQQEQRAKRIRALKWRLVIDALDLVVVILLGLLSPFSTKHEMILVFILGLIAVGLYIFVGSFKKKTFHIALLFLVKAFVLVIFNELLLLAFY